MPISPVRTRLLNAITPPDCQNQHIPTYIWRNMLIKFSLRSCGFNFWLAKELFVRLSSDYYNLAIAVLPVPWRPIKKHLDMKKDK